MKNVFAYIRVSGKSQVDGDGPDRQRDSIASFCKERFAILGERFERGVSGTVDAMERPEFSALIDEIECRRVNGEIIEGIVVERADRLARDLMVSELLLRECRTRSIKVFAADRGEAIDLASDASDPTQVLIRQILGALAQWEKTQLVMKLAKARAHKKAVTGRCEGRKPFGFRPAERKVLDFLNRLDSVIPDLTDAARARMLNEAELFKRCGKPWNRVELFKLRKRLAKGQIQIGA